MREPMPRELYGLNRRAWKSRSGISGRSWRGADLRAPSGRWPVQMREVLGKVLCIYGEIFRGIIIAKRARARGEIGEVGNFWRRYNGW